MPREVQGYSRLENTRTAAKVFVLSCEGTVTEPDYFKKIQKKDFFDKDNCIIKFVPRESTDTDSHPEKVLERLLSHKNDTHIEEMVSESCFTIKGNDTDQSNNFEDDCVDPETVFNNLVEYRDDNYLREDDEYWMIIDRDDWNTTHGVSFDEIYEKCRSNNFNLALSNPCFEIWILLHLIDIESLSKEQLELLLANKKVNASKNYIAKLIELNQNGRGWNKRASIELFSGVQSAIIRAEKIHKENENYPSGIGTHIFKLINKIIK